MDRKTLRGYAALPAALALTLASGCADGPDPLVGKWGLSAATCDGAAASLGAFGTFTLSYGSDGSFSAQVTPPGGACTIKVSGTWSRNGLDVTENQAQIDCGPAGCNSKVVPVCKTQTGVVAATFAHTYQANVPSDQMEQIKHNSNTVCGSNQAEVEDYVRQ